MFNSSNFIFQVVFEFVDIDENQSINRIYLFSRNEFIS